LTDGTNGNILSPQSNDFRFIDDVKDNLGNIISMDKVFDIYVETDINMGTDGETTKTTKSILPYVSRNFVLATPSQFIYHLKKLNMFSKINAFNNLEDNTFLVDITVLDTSITKLNSLINTGAPTSELSAAMSNLIYNYSQYKTTANDNQIFLYLIPSVSSYFNSSVNYFNVPIDVFFLDDNEKNKIITYLKLLGTMNMTSTITIIQPTITRYVSHVYIRRFENVTEQTIKQQVINTLSDFFLNNTRWDRIVKADIITSLKNIVGVDSCDIFFLSQSNEDYHRKGMVMSANITGTQQIFSPNQLKNATLTNAQTIVNPILQQPSIVNKGFVYKKTAYNPDAKIGIDTIHGDILIAKDEYPIVRGGWYDRNGLYYSDDLDSGGLTSVNVTFDGVTLKA
jgi:hypothetical protein